MKKLLNILIIAVSLLLTQASEAGIIVSNLVSGTQVIYTGRVRVQQIVAFGSTANDLRFVDSRYSTNQYFQPAYTRSTNFSVCVTNLQTNGIFVYTAATNYMIQTNVDCGNARSNISVNAGVVTYPTIAAMPIVSGAIASANGLGLVFERGISVSATNTATVIIYTLD